MVSHSVMIHDLVYNYQQFAGNC